MVIKAVAFDFGHTLIDEQKNDNVPLESRPIHLMPEVCEVLPFLSLPLAVWANTRTATEAELRHWLERAGIERFFAWVVTRWTRDVESLHPSSLILPWGSAR